MEKQDKTHTHVLEDGTRITHSHEPGHGHSHTHTHTKAVLNRLSGPSAIWNLSDVWWRKAETAARS